MIIEFGSACLSEFDLDIVSPLDISRYSAPETLAEGVSAASDWWSLGIILLEQLTRGRCFEQVHTNAFLIQVMTHGVTITDDLDENIHILLRGLLTRDRTQRWQWPEVSAWLDGRPMAAPVETNHQPPQHGRLITLAGQAYSQPTQFALKAAETTQWDEALSLLLRGELSSWLAGMSHYESIHPQLRLFTDMPEIDDNLRLMLTLKALNPDMPFIYRGEIVTPSWLLEHTDISYSLINDPLAQLLRQIDSEHWLVQLYYRQQQIRRRAEALEITLNENILRIYLLITSHSQLIARWQVHHRLFPDTHHSGLRTLIDRQNLQAEDLILLLSADIGQFIAYQTLLDQAAKLAKRYRISTFERTQAEALLQLPRLTLYQQLRERIGDFCRCGIADIDEWTEQFLLTRRLPLEQVIVMLAIAAEQWVIPEKQRYVQQVMQFFTRKITANTQRGSLVRMRLTPSAGRVDLTELSGVRKSAQDLLQHLINRSKNVVAIDSQTLLQMSKVNDRLRMLQVKTELYQRDTGINGMYLGFPFLLIHTQPSQMKPRIAPLFLWPVNLVMNAGQRGIARLQFDNERGAVRLNPALASLNGIPPVKEWQAILTQLLGHAGLTVDGVMEKLSAVMPVTTRNLSAEQDALDYNTQQLESTLADLQTLNREAFNKGLEYRQISPRRVWEEITRLTGKRARRLREFIEEGEALGLMRLRPVWLMTPDVASQILPLKPGFFDTVIYDEASQMPVEYLTFARNLTIGQREHNQTLLNKMCYTNTDLSDNNRTHDGLNDSFVQSVVNFVQQFMQQQFAQQQGWQIAKVQQAGIFYFDCIIEDKHSGRYIIGLECDMPHHPLLQQARAREIWRASVLKHVVPARYRISVTEWYHQPDIAQQKLVVAITQAFSTHNSTHCL
ncbi:DUF4011 domain-containing protein [Xenorhabdus entomophaga]|uniref:DUF4011 domain-containing protein n=1 Tax=Xenorhabdus entomophaga TaxID=3136257 RepID=UPI0030F4AB21